jgi:hypothetical protein
VRPFQLDYCAVTASENAFAEGGDPEPKFEARLTRHSRYVRDNHASLECRRIEDVGRPLPRTSSRPSEQKGFGRRLRYWQCCTADSNAIAARWLAICREGCDQNRPDFVPDSTASSWSYFALRVRDDVQAGVSSNSCRPFINPWMPASGELVVSPMSGHSGIGERGSHHQALQGQLIGHLRLLDPP